MEPRRWAMQIDGQKGYRLRVAVISSEVCGPSLSWKFSRMKRFTSLRCLMSFFEGHHRLAQWQSRSFAENLPSSQRGVGPR